MQLSTRKILDRSFTGLGLFSIVLMAGSLVVLIAPIAWRGSGAFVFQGTVEYRRMQLDQFGRGDRDAVQREVAEAAAARGPVYAMIDQFEKDLKTSVEPSRRAELRSGLDEIRKALAELLGPAPGSSRPVMERRQYGAVRWDRAEAKLHHLLYTTRWVPAPGKPFGEPKAVPRDGDWKGTALEPLFPYVRQHVADMLQPRWTFYPQFLTDNPVDSNMFGGIWPALLGTFYLTIGAILIAVPTGVITAVYLVEYARQGLIVSFLRTFISTLAGVPSIVFGLFGLALFLTTMHIPKSGLAGSLTLALLILPTIIRASEEAIKAVPRTYKEAALSLGAGRWRTVVTVILPAALPGILTGIIISMGRAAGETAPIIFTAAVSLGKPLGLLDFGSEPTQALPWSVYNLATEHAEKAEIPHVQYGMVLVLVSLVLLLNLAAIILRARISKKLRT